MTRVAVLRDLTIGPAHLSAIQAVAPSFNVELSVVGVRDASEIEHSVTAFARSSNGGMIVTASTSALVHRDLITMPWLGTDCRRSTASATWSPLAA